MIYVDPIFNARAANTRHTRWCHMMSDTSDEELHAMAKKLALLPAWFQGDHYDITPNKRILAISYGAMECESEKLVEIRRARRNGNV